MRRRLLVYGVWALVAPALIGAYAFSGARGAWADASGTQTPSHPWAFALTAPPAGITSAVALTSYAVAHDHARSARQVVSAGNRLIAQVPTGYRLAGRIGLGRIAVRERDGVFFICVRADVFEGVRQPRRALVDCAAGPLPLRFADVAWTTGRTLAVATRPAVYRMARQVGGAGTTPTAHAIAGLAVDWLSRLGHGRSGVWVDLVLAVGLLGAAAVALGCSRRRPSRVPWRGAVAGALGLVALDVAARVICGAAGPRVAISAGIVDVGLGGAHLHRHMSMWGDEGPYVELIVLLAVACAVVVAVRRSNGLLLFAAALVLLGTLTNLGEVAVRAYDTDYLWFGSAFRTSPFNLGDAYEFGGGVLMAYCCLRTVASAPRPPALHRAQAAGPRSAR